MRENSATLKIANFSNSPRLDSAAEHLRAGRLGEARADLEAEVSQSAGAARLRAVLLLAKVEVAAGDTDRVLTLLEEFRHAFDAERDDALLGWFHMTRGAARQLIVGRAWSADAAGSAYLDYEQAAYHLLRSSDFAEAGGALNNMAMMQHRAGRAAEARELLEKARACFADLPVRLAQADATEAEMFMHEGDARASRRLALRAANAFAEHGKDRLLSDLLPVLVWALARCESGEGGEGR